MPDARPPPEPRLLTAGDYALLLWLRQEVFSRFGHMRAEYDRLGIDYGQGVGGRDVDEPEPAVLKFPGV